MRNARKSNFQYSCLSGNENVRVARFGSAGKKRRQNATALSINCLMLLIFN
jgi:hypothetical protein